MDILKEVEEKDLELRKCYAIIQLQTNEINSLTERLKHLEQLLMYKAEIINKE